MLSHSGTAAIDLQPSRPDPEIEIKATRSITVPDVAGLDDTAGKMVLRPSGLYAPPQSSATNYNFLNFFSTATVYSPFISHYGIDYGMPSSPPPLPTEKREMPVIGFRGWGFSSRFRLGEGRTVGLKSTGVDFHWRPGDNHAACAGGHAAPDQNCACGFYVLANLDELESHVAVTDGVIVGAVMGWGKVVQHGTEGWRAEYARIVGLMDCKFSKGQLKNTQAVAAAYDVEIYSRNAIEAYLREWGDPFQA